MPKIGEIPNDSATEDLSILGVNRCDRRPVRLSKSLDVSVDVVTPDRGVGRAQTPVRTWRIADVLDGRVDANDLATAAADRAHFTNAGELVSELTRRGLLEAGRLTSAGREMTAAIQTAIATTTTPLWENLPVEDVAAAARVLNEIVIRARTLLASGPFTPVNAKNA